MDAKAGGKSEHATLSEWGEFFFFFSHAVIERSEAAEQSGRRVPREGPPPHPPGDSEQRINLATAERKQSRQPFSLPPALGEYCPLR